ncbi:hypothetical protein BDC45DRAFT_431582 [Circinella umbellata]|nr:hypothetical protein BDC45DRAFT_431582 [Circinella umbellata]
MLLPIWNHPLDGPSGTNSPAPQATACAHSGDIALTYNEGPSDVTAKVLNGLKNSQAKASFFVNATWLYTQQYAMILQRAYNDGHLIGMTYRAPDDTTENMTDDQIKTDVTNSAKVIETLIGVAPKYIRLHYTQPEDTRLQNIVRDMGYTLIYYNLDTQDYNFKNNPKGIAELYQTTFEKQLSTYDSIGSFITVQYDIPDTGSWQAVSDTINKVDTAGYKLVRLDGCLNDKEPYKESATSKKAVGDKHSFGSPGYKEGQVRVEMPPSMSTNDEIADSESADTDSQKTESTGSMTVSSWLSLFIFVIATVVLT